ncbi:MAG: polysaccharide pyruvyl transferase family protein [Lachnospiraceae bacterium]|nr:polysaccharide pyruvyl transferase family protein [Lachnospiraceae bacterium]
MKIGIITINSAYNYGCVLQAWSLQRFLEKEGHEAEIINYRTPAIDNVYRLFVPKKRFSNKFLNRCYNKLRRIKFNRTQKPRIIKAEKFEHFINEVMNTTETVYRSYKQLEDGDAGAPYDALITGSDQVWNGSITKGLKPAYFLAFEKTGKPKLAYASSIGKRKLSIPAQDFFRGFLREYAAIAVREASAQELLQPLLEQPVSVVLDPTLLLEKQDFDAMKVPSKYQQPYILVHVIGKDARLNAIVEQVSQQTGLPVVQNRMAQKYTNELGRFADAGPEEFLGLVEGAALVITNSFHATVFSVIYERNFITIPHKTYPERMANLLNEIGLSEHLIGNKELLPESIEELQPDYREVKERLQQRQEESREVLRQEVALAESLIQKK